MNILCNIHDFVIFLKDGLTWGCDHGDEGDHGDGVVDTGVTMGG